MTSVRRREGETLEPMTMPDEGASPGLPAYEPPAVVTYRREELLEELGPALACSFSGSVISC